MSEFIKRRNYNFENGKAYYEFVRDEEDILDATDIILMDKVSSCLYYVINTWLIVAINYFNSNLESYFLVQILVTRFLGLQVGESNDLT